MNIKRIVSHLLITHWQVNRAFPKTVMAAVEREINDSNSKHIGKIKFAVEGALHTTPLFKNLSSRDRAIELFSQLHVWDTEENNGLLIYLLLADRAVEIVCDRGISNKVKSKDWLKICHEMEDSLKNKDYEGAVIKGIREVTKHLVKHFPSQKIIESSRG